MPEVDVAENSLDQQDEQGTLKSPLMGRKRTTSKVSEIPQMTAE